jgi:hypothetical protein
MGLRASSAKEILRTGGAMLDPSDEELSKEPK